MNKKTHISICGIGPGHPHHITHAVLNQVDKADVLIGGKRQLAIFTKLNKKCVVFDGKTDHLKKTIEQIKEHHIVILVSGDTGFYSLRRFLKEAFPTTSIELFPGISTFQYFYAKLGFGYEKALLASMHGTEVNFIDELKNVNSVFLLTDRKNNFKAIAQTLVEAGCEHVKMHIGNNLSYPDEEIISISAKEATLLENDFALCSIIIENTDIQ